MRILEFDNSAQPSRASLEFTFYFHCLTIALLFPFEGKKERYFLPCKSIDRAVCAIMIRAFVITNLVDRPNSRYSRPCISVARLHNPRTARIMHFRRAQRERLSCGVSRETPLSPPSSWLLFF